MSVVLIDNPSNYAMRKRYGSSRTKDSIKYIVVHYTGTKNAPNAINFIKSAQNNYAESSAHIFVDDNVALVSVPLNYVAWHCGTRGKYYHKYCRNANSIGIEMCCEYINGEWIIHDQVLKNTQELVRQLMKEYNIPIENVVRHYDVTHKLCPRPLVDETKWNTFKEGIELVRYEKLEDIPEFYRNYVDKYIKAGYIAGKGDGVLDLTEDMIRTLIFTERMLEDKE